MPRSTCRSRAASVTIRITPNSKASSAGRSIRHRSSSTCVRAATIGGLYRIRTRRTGLEPHAPESALLLGEAGWFPPNAEIDVGEILGTHGTDRNERLCATCHVNKFTVTDEATGEFVFQSTGHLFTAIPCVDEQGIPTPGGVWRYRCRAFVRRMYRSRLPCLRRQRGARA